MTELQEIIQLVENADAGMLLTPSVIGEVLSLRTRTNVDLLYIFASSDLGFHGVGSTPTHAAIRCLMDTQTDRLTSQAAI